MLTVVTGPPCAGKSTYIADNASAGDVVVDMDVIARALVFGPVVSHDYSERVRVVARAARNAAVKKVLMLAQSDRRSSFWVIHTDPDADLRRFYRLHGARFVEVNPGRDVCLARLASRPSANQLLARAVIDVYFSAR